MSTALLSLGSNLGDRSATLDAALEKLRLTARIPSVTASSYHATRPIGGPAAQGEYLNAAALVETSLSPRELLVELQRIEQELGRVRTTRWGERTIDLDILLFDDQMICQPDLIIPHRFLPFRRFVLEPAIEIAPATVHPALKVSLRALLDQIQAAPNVFRVSGDNAQQVETLARQIASGLEMACAPENQEAATDFLVFVLGAQLRKIKASLRLITECPAHDEQPGLPAELFLPANDFPRALAEAVAAIQGMQ